MDMSIWKVIAIVFAITTIGSLLLISRDSSLPLESSKSTAQVVTESKVPINAETFPQTSEATTYEPQPTATKTILDDVINEDYCEQPSQRFLNYTYQLTQTFYNRIVNNFDFANAPNWGNHVTKVALATRPHSGTSK
jgi:hypothetical protein